MSNFRSINVRLRKCNKNLKYILFISVIFISDSNKCTKKYSNCDIKENVYLCLHLCISVELFKMFTFKNNGT